MKVVRNILFTILFYCAIFGLSLYLVTYMFKCVRIMDNSMSPEIDKYDVIVLSKSYYKNHLITYGDVIIFEYTEPTYLARRIVGLPGDKISIKKGFLFINDEPIMEDYINNSIQMNDFDLTELGYSVVPDNYYFVLGDNRNASLDSRNKEIGLIRKDRIKGKVAFRLYSYNKMNLGN